MRLEFRSEHLSIDRFDPVEVGDFAVITGVNGSGKTHLLRAIRNGSVSADAIGIDDIVFFDLFEFQLANENEYMLKQILEERHTVWSAFSDERQSSLYGRTTLKATAEKFLTAEEITAIETVAKNKSTHLLALTKKDLGNNELLSKLTGYKRHLRELFRGKKLQNDHSAQRFLQMLKSIQCFPHNISEPEFLQKYETSPLKEHLIPTQLGKIFMEYRINEFVTIHKGYERGEDAGNVESGSGDSARDGHDRYAGAAPWETINEFLGVYTGEKYSITHPERISVDHFVNRSASFKPRLINREKNITVSYGDLSSGEKVLFMLALCMFKASTRSVFPRLLLLDEIDATLHPSMIKNLLAVIDDVLLSKGTKVVLATHSPTTVALVPEERIFVVNPNGPDRIAKATKNDAIQVLTEGYMTMEDTIKMFDQTTQKKICVISEGDNVDYIKKAVSIFAKKYEDQIHVIDSIRDISDKNQLKTIFNFFVHVNHGTPIFVVWDPDCYKFKKLAAENNTHPFILLRNPNNTICRSSGIESLFDDSCFDESEIFTTSQGAQTTNRSFDSKKKQQFKSRMLDNANVESFGLFKGLVESIVLVLEREAEHER